MNPESQSKDLTPKVFFIAMGVLFILLQLAFHPEYIKFFPEFQGFNWIHHIHGALMVSWVVMLIIQPFLIHKSKYKTHRTIGKISYLLAPLMIVSMFYVTKLNYLSTVGKIPFKDVAHIQSLNFITPLNFLLFYSLAIINRKDNFKHQRYMIGTSFIMLTAVISRNLQHSFGASIEPFDFYIPLYLGVLIAAALLVNDILKKKNPFPYAIVTITLGLNTILFHARYTELWQSIVRIVGNNLFE